MQVFISYRRSDAPSASRQLADALKLRFGSNHVFFDTRDVAAGTEWRSDTVRRVQESDVVLVVIGPHWATAAEERAHRSVLDPEAEDVVRLEVETAFTRRRMVIPVLVDDAEMPPRETLPRPFRPLADVQAQTLHHASWDRDLEALVEVLVHLGTGSRPWEAPPAPAPERHVGATNSDPERVARYIGDGRVVTVVGCGTHGLGPDPGSLPNTIELVRQLVRRFGIGSEKDDLARVSQHVMLVDGKADLYRALRELLIRVDGEPGSVHRFVARVPARLRDAAASVISCSSRRTTTPRWSAHSTLSTSRTTSWCSWPAASIGAASSTFHGGIPTAMAPGSSLCRTSTWTCRSTSRARSSER